MKNELNNESTIELDDAVEAELVKFFRNRITEFRIQRDISEIKMSYESGNSRNDIHNIVSGGTLP